MVAMTNDDINTTIKASEINWSLLADFVPAIAMTLLFLAWLVMGAGSGSGD